MPPPTPDEIFHKLLHPTTAPRRRTVLNALVNSYFIAEARAQMDEKAADPKKDEQAAADKKHAVNIAPVHDEGESGEKKTRLEVVLRQKTKKKKEDFVKVDAADD